MMQFTERELLDVTGGAPVGTTADAGETRTATSVSTDTRTVLKGALFVALKGERFDGHAFLAAALEKGASLVLISDLKALPAGASGILVPDTLIALHAIARAYRRKLGCKVVAVTGSVGKTSTREMLCAILSGSFRTHATKHNLNNDIGLPMTILTAPSDTELLIVEMGMRMRGEISTLTKIAEPDIAVITNIGVSHIERLGSREEILRAKMEICEGLTGDRYLLINGEDDYLPGYISGTDEKKWDLLGVTALISGDDSFAFADRVVTASDYTADGAGTSFFVRYRSSPGETPVDLGTFHVGLTGIHHIKNALFSIAAAMHLGVPADKIREGLLSYKPVGSRGRTVYAGKILIYDDAYNASPESMAAAFESVRLLAAGRRKLAALGSILELGKHAAEEHYKVGISAVKSGMDMIFACGGNAADIKAGALSVCPDLPVRVFEDRESLTRDLLSEIRENDILLVKGSHAFEMGKVADAVMTKAAETEMTKQADTNEGIILSGKASL